MSTVEKEVNDQLCTGCGGCENICPTDAITMRENYEGFIMPSVDGSKCVNCKKCLSVCPALNVKHKNSSTPKMFAVRASDNIRGQSSSGGMFTLLAEKVIGNGGVVYGAAFDKNMRLRHISAESSEELAPLKGSKYLQSSTGKVYREIKQQLKNGREVLFTGTPCQVAALYRYLGRKIGNLYTADLLCHGVPSQYLFDKYTDELYQKTYRKKGSAKIKDVRFRDKRFGWSAEHIIADFDKGESYISDLSEDRYLKMFLRNLGLRKSCGSCPFSEFPRQGDISIGDFWGISRISPDSYDGKGTSLVFVNSKKGSKLFASLTDNEIKCEQIKFEPDKLNNRTHAIFPANQNRDRFLSLVKKKAFSQAVDEALSERYDVGIVSNWCAKNFGGSLTQYALYNTAEDMGYSALMIERSEEAPVKANAEMASDIYIDFPYPPYSCAKQYKTNLQMSELNQYCGRFLVGSDQLFQYKLYADLGKFVNLDWADDSKPKTAYAASFGHDRVWGSKDELLEMSYYMKRFDHFSVREKSGVNICREIFGIEVQSVLDPVFLCDPRHYEELIAKSERKLEKKYIASYILDPDENKYNTLKKVIARLGLPEEIYSELGYPPEYVEPLGELNVVQLKIEERLHSIKNCDFFVTDSFHGTCFAILFKKPFISILNTKRGGSRFISLLETFGLENRLIKDADEINEHPELFEDIDYDAVYKILDAERSRCLEWLKDALSLEMSNPKEDGDIVNQIIEIQKKKIADLESRVGFLTDQLDYTLHLLGVDFIKTTDLFKYLEELERVKERYLICISVKDTPGIVFSQELVPLMEKLGLKKSLYEQHWHPYLAVLDRGRNVYESIGEIDQELTFETKLDNLDIELLSSSYKGKNRSEIIIDGKDYSKDIRGLNIVVYDRKCGCIADSVSFDTNTSAMTCSR